MVFFVLFQVLTVVTKNKIRNKKNDERHDLFNCLNHGDLMEARRELW
jgi:hypothetical protein